MKLLFACRESADDPNVWSGLVWHILGALKGAGFDVEVYDDIPFECPIPLRLLHQCYKRLTTQVHFLQIEPAILKRAAHRIERQFFETRCQAVFCLGTGVPVNAFIRRSIPVFTYADATKRSWIQTYFGLETLCQRSRQLVSLVDRHALENNTLSIFSSEWAVEAAHRETGCAMEKVTMVPFGANLSDPPTRAEVETFISTRIRDRKCRLLFLGKEWRRKGGPEALEVVCALRAAGILAELDIIGCAPDFSDDSRPWIRIHKFVDRSTSAGRALFRDIVTSAHFLLFFSRAEAFGLALCEANAFGVPCLATSVGGIPTIVREGINGFLFKAPLEIMDCVSRIIDLLGDDEAYEAVARSARAEFEDRLNWNAAGQQIRQMIESRLIGARTPGPPLSHVSASDQRDERS